VDERLVNAAAAKVLNRPRTTYLVAADTRIGSGHEKGRNRIRNRP